MEFNAKREKYLLEKATVLLEEVITNFQNKEGYGKNKILAQILVHYIYLNKVKKKVLDIHEKLFYIINKMAKK